MADPGSEVEGLAEDLEQLALEIGMIGQPNCSAARKQAFVEHVGIFHQRVKAAFAGTE